MGSFRSSLAVTGALAATLALASAAAPSRAGASAVPGTAAVGTAAQQRGGDARWVTGWSANPVVGSDNPFNPNCPSLKGLDNQTVRNVVFLSAGGDTLRVRLSNAFGTRALQVGHATVAVQSGGGADAVPGTLRTLTFGGRTDISIVAGGEVLSDPVRLSVAALSTVLLSVYLPEQTGPLTHHPGTAQGNFIATGDLSTSLTGAGYTDMPCWLVVDAVDVRAPHRFDGTVVALGDSITDTAATTGNANRRWPDDLARRLNARKGKTLSVSNAGIGGDRLLAPREGEPYFGVPVLARLDRDVFAATGARDVILLIGVNDIGFDATAAQLIAGLQQVVAQTHARGLRIFGGTITGFGGSFLDTPAREATRDAVNAWIAGPDSHFDGVVDFARALADPANPDALLPAYDSGDHLHPNDAGCQAMADAVDLAALLN